MASTLTIAGTAYAVAARGAARIQLHRLTAPNLDGDDSLEFSERAASYPGTWARNAAVRLTIDGTVRFTGVIVSKDFGEDAAGICVGYQCLGLSHLAQQVPVVQPRDGSTEWIFNREVDDADYLASESGQSVGQILTQVLTASSMAGPLAAAGIGAYTSTTPYTLPAATAADLAALTLVPPQPVPISGTRLWNSLVQLLAQWQRNHVPWIDPATGTIRVLDTAAFTSRTLTLDSDPVLRPQLASSIQDCYTRVQVVGGGDIEPVILSTRDGSLAESSSWTGFKATWTIQDFQQPGGASDEGAVTAVGSTSVTIDPTDNTRTWAANFWSGVQAQVTLLNPVASGISYSETRPVTANGALAAAGTCSLTLGYALASGGYTKYRLIGKATGKVDTYRTYNVVDSYIASHMVKRFPIPVSWSVGGRGVSGQVRYPAAAVCWSSSHSPPFVEAPATFDLVPGSGQIRFHQPTVSVYSTPTQLNTGGSSVVVPDDIVVVVPVNRGNLTATAPADVSGVPRYQGSAHTSDGLERTLTLPVPSWYYRGDLASMQSLAQMYLDSVKNIVVEGSVTYLGQWNPGLDVGQALSLAHPTATTGWETLAAPIRAVTLDWPGDGGAAIRTTLRVSTRRNPYTGDRLYIHPAFAEADWGGSLAAADFGMPGLEPGEGGFPTPHLPEGMIPPEPPHPEPPPATESEAPADDTD